MSGNNSAAAAPKTNSSDSNVIYSPESVGKVSAAVPRVSGFDEKSTAQEIVTKFNNIKSVTFLVTGGNTGIGYETVRSLASGGATVYFTARDTQKGQDALSSLKSSVGETYSKNIHFIYMDLSSLESVRKAADSFISKKIPLHVLILNAGTLQYNLRYTVDDFESTFVVNYLSHFLLSYLLAPVLSSSSTTERPSRIITVSSLMVAYMNGSLNFDDLNYKKNPESYSGILAYTQSKLANILFNYQFSKLYQSKGINTLCLHPGVISTQLIDNYSKDSGTPANFEYNKSVEQGAATTVYAAIASELTDKTGLYLQDCNIAQEQVEPYLGPDWKYDAEKLWSKSLQFLSL